MLNPARLESLGLNNDHVARLHRAFAGKANCTAHQHERSTMTLHRLRQLLAELDRCTTTLRPSSPNALQAQFIAHVLPGIRPLH